MRNLIPLSVGLKKKLGIVSTKNGLMIDKTRLSEIKKFQRKPEELPQQSVVKKKSVEEMVKQEVTNKDGDIGLY